MKQQVLKNWLLSNSIFSAVSAVFLVLGKSLLDTIFNNNIKWLFPVIGVGILLFSLYVFWVGTRQLNNRKWVYSICVMDIVWVTASFIFIFYAPFPMNFSAIQLIFWVAIIVLIFGIQQYRHSPK